MSPLARACLFAPLLAAACTVAQAGSMDLRVPFGGTYAVKVTSLKEARYRTTIAQRYDYSCGSAAVATLLTFQYGYRIGEEEVFREMYARGDEARIRKEGFSLLDMRRFLRGHGFEGDGFALPLDKLLEAGLPAIVLLNDRGYRHFVVVKGLRGGRVLVGDPARGTRSLARAQFEHLWDNRVLFVVHNRRESAAFNLARDWRTAPPAPIESGIGRDGLREVVMPRRGAGDI